MPKYTSNRIDLNVGFNVDKTGLDQVKKTFQQIQNIKPTSFKGSQGQLNLIKEKAKQVEVALEKAFNVKLNTINIETFRKELSTIAPSMDKLYADFAKLGSAGKAAFNAMSSSLMTTNIQLRETQSLLQSFGNTMINTIKWGFASSIINGFTSSIQQAVSYVEGLDKSLTNIRIVTGDSREEMAQFADQANRASQALGRSTMDYTKAALSYYQQGLSDEQVAARTEATLKAQNITGAGQEMADYLTAVWNGYRVANEEAELYVDKMAAVADSSASNMAQLATAMSKVASTADMMGVPMDSLNAQIATIVATTRQAPESVGNALKTIYTRVADIKTGSQDAQISLGNYSSKMKEVGIDVLDSSGRFRDLGDIIEQIGSKWSGLSKEQQIYLARTMAGQRQINNLLALFNNWDKYSDLVNTSMESQGTTMEKNSRYMESLAAHLEQLNAAQQRFKSSMIDSDSFKGLVDIGTGLTTFAANFIQAIGGGGNALLMLGSVATKVFGNIISRQIANAVQQSRDLKAIFAEVRRAEQQVAQARQSAAYNDPNNTAYKNYVDNLTAMQRSWSALTQEERQEQEQRANSIRLLAEQKTQIQQTTQVSEQFLNTLKKNTGNYPGLKQIETQIEKIQIVANKGQAEINDFFVAITSGFPGFSQSAVQNIELLINRIREFAGVKVDQDFLGSSKILTTLDKIRNDVNLTDEQFEQLRGELQFFFNQAGVGAQGIPGIETAKQQVKNLDVEIQKTSRDFQRMNQYATTAFNIKAVMNYASALTSIFSAISSISNISKTLKSDLPTGEKFLQVGQGIAAAAMMSVMAFTQLKNTMIGTFVLGIVEGVKLQLHLAGMSAQTITLTGLFGALGVAIKAAFAPLLPLLGPILAISAAVTGLVLVSKTLYDVWTADARAAKQTAQTARQVKQAYDNVKQSADDLRSSLDQYEQIQDSFKDLTAGTEEWNQKLRESNELVLQLIQKFPQLAQYVSNVDGKLVLDTQGLDQFQKKIDAEVNKVGAANDMAQSRARTAAINAQATNLGRQDAVLGTALSKDIVLDIANKLIDFQDGNRSENNLEEFVKNVAAQNGNINEKLVQALIDDTSGMAQLTSAIREDTNATAVANEARVKSSEAFTQSTEYLAASNDQRNIMQQQAINSLDNASSKLASDIEEGLRSGFRARDIKNSSNVGGTGFSGDDLLQAARSYFGNETLSWAANSMQGSGKNRQFVFNGAGGSDQKISASAMADLLATSQAIQNLGNSASQTKAMLDALTKATGEQGQQTAQVIRKFLADDLGSLTQEQLNNALSNLDSSALTEFFNEYAEQAGYQSGEEFKKAVLEQTGNISESFNKIAQDLSPFVQGIFNSLDLSKTSYDVQSQISEQLQQAYNELGEEGSLALAGFYKNLQNIEDIDSLEELTTQLDWNNTSVQDFKQALDDAGIATNASTQQLQAYIDAQKEAAGVISPEEQYKAIHDITDKLKDGGSIDAQQAQTLKAANINLDQFFKKMPDGTFKLKTSAKEFQETVNRISLDSFKDEIQSLQEQYNTLQNFSQNSRFSAANNQGNENATFEQFIDNSNLEHNTQLIKDRLQFLRSINIEDQKQLQTIQEINTKLEHKQQLSRQEAEELSKVVANHRQEWQNMDEEAKATMQRINQLQEEMSNARVLDSDVNEEEFNRLADYLQENAGTGDFEDVASLQDYQDKVGQYFENAEEAARQFEETMDDVSQSMLRYQAAVQAVTDKYDDWKKALNSDSISDQIEAGEQLQNVYSDLLDLPYQNLSPDFTQSTQNLNLLKQAVQGNQQAYISLQQKAAQDILMHGEIDLDADAAAAKVDEDLDYIRNTVQSFTGQDFGDIEVGAALNDADFLNGLTNMVNQAGMTAEEATDYLASMGIDAQVVENPTQVTDTYQNQGALTPHISWTPINVPVITKIVEGITGGNVTTQIPSITWSSETDAGTLSKTMTATSLKVKSAKKSSGGGFKHRKATPSSSGKKSGGKKGGSGSTPKAASQAKINTSTIDTKAKTAQTNPYQQQQKAFQRQEKILDNLQNKQKKLVNKDRLKNLKDQNKTLEEQVKILNKELDISKNQAAENSTANYAKRLKDAFGSVLRFDSDGQISDINALERASVNTYNAAAKAAADAFEKQKAKYNDYITNTWNKYSTQEQQEANKTEKEYWDQRVKNAEEAAKKAISAAQEEYKTREDLIKSYNSAWEADQDRLEKIRDLQDQIIEKQIAISQIKVDLSIDTGQAERDWLEFEKKFIKKIDDDDFLGQAKASVKQLMSYFDSKQIQETANQIKQLQKEIAIMQAGGFSSIYGDDKNSAKERLEELMKQQMSDLQDIQDLVDDIKDNYLDAIDDAKDKMDQQINQYERINDLIDHNVKLTELIYGDKAYETLSKYYDLMQKNNQQELDSLKRQQEYWQERMNQQVIGSDAWQQFKKNLDDTTDSLNDKLEEMIDNLSKKWQNKVDGIIEKLNNGLTGNRGLDYLDEQWDYINNYDDNFLDTVNSVMGTREVERLYKQASDDLSQNPKQQQKINKLMNQQLKILKEKNKLTEYDIERAKALLQVEQARIALEDARNNKTKMRLRRDSQGNYTYQYVADEEKLTELQAALDDAQANLYNMDKQHYKQNLNKLYDTYKDYLERMRALQEEYRKAEAAGDQEEKARIQARIGLMNNQFSKLWEGLSEDNKYALQYLKDSFADGLGIDKAIYSAEEFATIMNQNISQMQSNIQDLQDKIAEQGGLINATADAIKNIKEATHSYNEEMNNTLNATGSSVEAIIKATDEYGNALDKNIQNTEKFITANEKLIANCHSQIEEIRTLMDLLNNYLDNAMSVESLVSNLRGAYNIDQILNGSKLTADVNIPIEDFNIDTTFSTLDQYQKYLSNMAQKEKQLSSTEIGNIWTEIQNKINSAEQGSVDLKTSDLQSMFKAVQMVRNMTNALSGFSANQLASLGMNTLGSLIGTDNNNTIFDQEIHIDAHFPNVTSSDEIIRAIEMLPNMATQKTGYNIN